MDILYFMVPFTYGLLPLSDGFLILHSRKEQCLLGNREKVLVGACDLKNPWQEWQWTGQDRLRLWHIDQCLAVVNSSNQHTRTLVLQDCATAPRWKCYDEQPDRIGLAHPEMFLRKMGYLAVVKAGKKYHDSWLKYQLGENGQPVKLDMCPTQVTSQANSLKDDPPSFRGKNVKWMDDVARGVTEQVIEPTTDSSSVSSPSSFPRSEDPCSRMTCFYNHTEKHQMLTNSNSAGLADEEGLQRNTRPVKLPEKCSAPYCQPPHILPHFQRRLAHFTFTGVKP